MATVRAFPHRPNVDELLRSAIRERRLVSFTHGLTRRAEPHDWRWAILTEMQDVRVLDERFAGTRETPTGRHVKWDVLLASVSRDVESLSR